MTKKQEIPKRELAMEDSKGNKVWVCHGQPNSADQVMVEFEFQSFNFEWTIDPKVARNLTRLINKHSKAADAYVENMN